MIIRECRVCGCTDITACVHDDGSPCAWVDEDLCTVCDDKSPIVRDKLLAAASSLASATESAIEGGRAPEQFLRDLKHAPDSIAPWLLDALRLVLEATDDTNGALYAALVAELAP